jgi:hypothetical protein
MNIKREMTAKETAVLSKVDHLLAKIEEEGDVICIEEMGDDFKKHGFEIEFSSGVPAGENATYGVYFQGIEVAEFDVENGFYLDGYSVLEEVFLDGDE